MERNGTGGSTNLQALESLLRALLLHTEPCYWPAYFQLRFSHGAPLGPRIDTDRESPG